MSRLRNIWRDPRLPRILILLAVFLWAIWFGVSEVAGSMSIFNGIAGTILSADFLSSELLIIVGLYLAIKRKSASILSLIVCISAISYISITFFYRIGNVSEVNLSKVATTWLFVFALPFLVTASFYWANRVDVFRKLALQFWYLWVLAILARLFLTYSVWPSIRLDFHQFPVTLVAVIVALSIAVVHFIYSVASRRLTLNGMSLVVAYSLAVIIMALSLAIDMFVVNKSVTVINPNKAESNKASIKPNYINHGQRLIKFLARGHKNTGYVNETAVIASTNSKVLVKIDIEQTDLDIYGEDLTVSPDGQYLVGTSGKTLASYIYKADGSKNQICDGQKLFLYPGTGLWLEGGKKLLIIGDKQYGSEEEFCYEILVFAAENGQLLKEIPLRKHDNKATLDVSAESLSADGTGVFLATKYGEQIQFVNLEDSSITEIYNQKSRAGYINHLWTLSRGRVAYTRFSKSYETSTWVLDLASKNEKLIALGIISDDKFSDVSPDQNYAARIGKNSHTLQLINLKTGRIVVLRNDTFNAVRILLDWAADSKTILIGRDWGYEESLPFGRKMSVDTAGDYDVYEVDVSGNWRYVRIAELADRSKVRYVKK